MPPWLLRAARPGDHVSADSQTTAEAYSAADWPIAAAMLPFPGTLDDGVAVQDAPPERWLDALLAVAAAGFTEVDPTDSWLRVADLSVSRRADFVEVLNEAGLRLRAISTARRSVIDPTDGDENLAYSHRVIDAAAALGATVVSFGLHRPLTGRQKEVLWFWTVPGTRDPDDPAVRQLAVGRFRELGKHAAEVGLEVSLEMYEDTYLGTADEAVALVDDIAQPNVGLNPDLGNLLRMQRPVEDWESMARKTLPYANYWHVKNYYRTEDPASGTVVTMPAPMEYGVMNYRRAVQLAVDAGFRGAFCTEHYGGDGLSVSATNRDYLRRILPNGVQLNDVRHAN